MKTTHEPTHVTLRLRDPLCLIRSFADSMAEGLLGPEDIGALHHAIAYAEDEIGRFCPFLTICSMRAGMAEKRAQRGRWVASDRHGRAA